MKARRAARIKQKYNRRCDTRVYLYVRLCSTLLYSLRERRNHKNRTFTKLCIDLLRNKLYDESDWSTRKSSKSSMLKNASEISGTRDHICATARVIRQETEHQRARSSYHAGVSLLGGNRRSRARIVGPSLSLTFSLSSCCTRHCQTWSRTPNVADRTLS